MSAIEYRHTWTLPRDSKVIRFYMWLWDASPRDVNFCKLFWGYLFAPLALIARLVASPFTFLARRVRPLLPDPQPLSEEEQMARLRERLARQAERRARKQRILERIEYVGAKFVMFWSRLVWWWLRYILIVAVGLVGLAAVAAVIYFTTGPWWHVTWKVLVTAAIFTPMALGFAAGMVWADDRGTLDRPKRALHKAATVVLAPVLFFGWIMVTGFKGVKSNTCPRVVLVDTDDPTISAEC